MSLSWRLITSYVIIIIVCLTLAFATLILISRPLQTRLLGVRLAVESRQAASRANDFLQQGGSMDRILSQVDSWGARNRFRLLLVDAQGLVLADSQDIWEGYRVSLRGRDGSGGATGQFDAPGGGSFTYAATPVGPGDQPRAYLVTVTPGALGLSRLVRELGSGFVVAGLVALLLSLLLGIVIARSIALPLQRIATAAGAVAAGDYEQRLKEAGPPDIKRVAASFNVMIERVEGSQQAMRDFVSNVSHELKTPLTSIQGFSQALMEGATQNEAARQRAASIIHEEATRLTRMVEDLLDLARIDSGQVVMSKTPLELTDILTDTVNRLLPQAARKQIKLVKQWGKLPPIVGDGDRLAQVFTNFLDNAIRHTPAGGQVTVSSHIARGLPRPRRVRLGSVQPQARTKLSERGDFVEISIADTGPGIPPEDLARIFERFYQVDKSRKRSRGTGLGLAITKEIVEAHGGYVRAESVEGVGTKFTVTLPVSEADALTLVSNRRKE